MKHSSSRMLSPSAFRMTGTVQLIHQAHIGCKRHKRSRITHNSAAPRRKEHSRSPGQCAHASP